PWAQTFAPTPTLPRPGRAAAEPTPGGAGAGGVVPPPAGPVVGGGVPPPGGAVVGLLPVVVVVVGGSVPSVAKRATPWATAPLTLWNCPATRTEPAVTWRSSTPCTPLIVGAQGWMAPLCWSKAARWPRTCPPTSVKWPPV